MLKTSMKPLTSLCVCVCVCVTVQNGFWFSVGCETTDQSMCVCDCTEWVLVQCRLVSGIHPARCHCVAVSSQSVSSHWWWLQQQELWPRVSQASLTHSLTYVVNNVFCICLLVHWLYHFSPLAALICSHFCLILFYFYSLYLLDGLVCCTPSGI